MTTNNTSGKEATTCTCDISYGVCSPAANCPIHKPRPDKPTSAQQEGREEKFVYCQREVEMEERCDRQCNHCKIYYQPLEKDALVQSLTSQLSDKDKRIAELEERLVKMEQSSYDEYSETNQRLRKEIAALQSKLQGERAAAAKKGWVAGNERGRRYPNESYIGRNMELSTYLNNNYPSKEEEK